MKTIDFEHLFLAGWRPFAWIALLVVLVYGQTASFGFVGYDDDALITNNETLAFSIENLITVFSDDVMRDQHGLFYRPVLSLSYMLDYAVGGKNPAVYHAANLLYHLLAVYALFALLLALGVRRAAAFLLSAIVAVHPVLVQAVAWLPGRNDILLALFTILTVLSFWRYMQKRATMHLLLHSFWLMVALLTKETALIIPVLCLVAWYVLLRRDIGSRRLLPFLPSWVLVSALWMVLRMNALGGSARPVHLTFFAPADLIAGWLSYLGKIFWPLHLQVFPVAGQLPVIEGMVAMLLLAGLAWRTRVPDRGQAVFGLLWFFLFLAPTIVRGTDDAAFLEHRLYLPMAGLAIALNALRPWQGLSRTVVLAFFSAVLVLFSVKTFTHSRLFARDVTFWQAAVAGSPRSAFVYYGRANTAMRHGDESSAEFDYQKALSLQPGFARAAYNLGNLYLKKGEYRKAAAAYRQALRTAPNHLDALINLSVAYRKLGQTTKAVELLKRAQSIDPSNAAVKTNLASVLAETGTAGDAEAAFQQLMRERPGDAAVYFNYGNFLQKRGRWKDAARSYRQALKIDSTLAQAWSNLGVSLAQTGDVAGAEKALLSAIRIDPGQGRAHANLALLYLAQNRRDEARKHAGQAESLGFSLPEAARKALGQ